jgi:heme exporter protein CcmD
MSEFGAHGYYILMAYGAVALGVVVEVLAVRARRRRSLELARHAPPETLPAPAGNP